jgi:5-methylcytosine-specific restriction endonuclease McrA
VAGETCEIPGVGPIPVGRARDYLLGGAFLKVLITKGVDIRSVCHYGRHIPAELLTAIEFRDHECAVAGCHRQLGLEIHHIEDHARGGPTALFNLVSLCRHDHDLVTHRGYALGHANQHGKRKLIPPATPPPDP